jgi:hypothetical protein
MNFDKIIDEILKLAYNQKVHEQDKKAMIKDTLDEIYSQGYQDGLDKRKTEFY